MLPVEISLVVYTINTYFYNFDMATEKLHLKQNIPINYIKPNKQLTGFLSNSNTKLMLNSKLTFVMSKSIILYSIFLI